jgi:hypothetical protein
VFVEQQSDNESKKGIAAMIQWFANRTIRQKLVLGFGTLIALVVLLAAITVRNNVAVQANYEALADDSFPVQPW